MNAVKEINRINQRELELGVAGKGTWHDEYKDSAYVFVGGLSYDLTEGDVITIFSQWGEVVDINLPRDKETGKKRGFGFVMFEDQRSTNLAVDNMNGAQVLGRTIRVDHCRKYTQQGTRNEEGDYIEPENPTYNAMPPLLSDSESESSEEDKDELDDEDPMAAYLRGQKRKEKSKAKALTEGGKRKRREGETKEERKARHEAKRAKRAEKERRKTGRGVVKLERDEEPKGRRSDGPAGTGREDGWAERKGRANRDDWRKGRWELDRAEKDRDGRRVKEDVGEPRRSPDLDRRRNDREDRHAPDPSRQRSRDRDADDGHRRRDEGSRGDRYGRSGDTNGYARSREGDTYARR